MMFPKRGFENRKCRLDNQLFHTFLNSIDVFLKYRQDNPMILSFADKETELIWHGQRSKKLPPMIQERARVCLRRIAAAVLITDLRIPPGNRLHCLVGDRAHQHAIRINEQWRITFTWTEQGATNVKIEDYHK